MLQIGDVDFDTAAGDDYNFIFAGVADPAEVVHMVDQATGAASTEGLGDEAGAAGAPSELRRPPEAGGSRRPRRGRRGRRPRAARRRGRCAPR